MRLLAVAGLAAIAGCTCQGRKADVVDAAVAAAAPRKVRPAAVAGSWYPGGAGELQAYVDRLLDEAPQVAPEGGTQVGPVRALIEPHAGYRFSGAVAATGYRLVRGQSYRRVIVLAPAHRGFFRGASIGAAAAYATPLGLVPVDVEAVRRLRAEPLFGDHEGADRGEHSIEMQLPLLQRALAPGWQLVPVLLGEVSDEDAGRLAAALRPLADDGTLVVASGDFTHYGANYDYHPFPLDGEIAARLRRLDDGAYERIAARDGPGLAAYRARTGINACGFHSSLVLVHLLPPDARAQLVRYDTSGAIGNDYTSSVSYLAVAFRGPHAPSQADEVLSEEEMGRLHLLASRAVEAAAAAGADVPAERVAAGVPVDGRLARKAGAFVTLKRAGRLRGCIGFMEERQPIWRTVVEVAQSSAIHDGRFPPVRPEEVAGLDLEVSVLSPLRPIASWREFFVGAHGIVMEKGGRRAVYLPEVAVEQRWTREQTLGELSLKAGLDEQAWREGARFFVFTSQIRLAPLVVGRAAQREGHMPQIKLESLPRTVDEFKRMRDAIATTPIGGAAMFAAALNVYADDPKLGTQLLTLAIDAAELTDGPEGVAGKQPTALRAFRERNGGKPWVARSMFQGATPENGYQLPPPPLVIEYREQPGDLRGDDAKVFIQTTGADNAKPMRLRRNDKGIWKAFEWSSFQGNCRPPKTPASDDL